MSKNILKYNNHRVFFVISIYENIKKYQVYCNGWGMTGSNKPPESIQGKEIVSINCGGYETAVLLNDNTIKCWGFRKKSSSKLPNSTQGRIVSIKCGKFHYCVLLNDMTVVCWGSNIRKQCDVPDSIQGKVISISCGYHHTVALLNDNTVKCWGYNFNKQCNVPNSIQKEFLLY